MSHQRHAFRIGEGRLIELLLVPLRGRRRGTRPSDDVELHPDAFEQPVAGLLCEPAQVLQLGLEQPPVPLARDARDEDRVDVPAVRTEHHGRDRIVEWQVVHLIRVDQHDVRLLAR